WKAMVAVVSSTALVAYRFRKEISRITIEKNARKNRMPAWVSFMHLVLLVLIVVSSHHMPVFILLFLFFLGIATVTKEYQNELRIKEGLLVGFFLGGL